MKIEIVFKDGRKEIFENVASFTATEELAVEKEPNAIGARPAVNQTSARKVAKTPTEGMLFEINPLGLDRSRFEKKRGNQEQEWIRKRINEAFAEVDRRPQEYAESFYTLMPEKIWDGYRQGEWLKQYAKHLGGQMADWIQQALEWAQRICNGESWEAVCNDAETAKWYRLIIWKNGLYQIVGVLHNGNGLFQASDVVDHVYRWYDEFRDTVPLVAIKKTA